MADTERGDHVVQIGEEVALAARHGDAHRDEGLPAHPGVREGVAGERAARGLRRDIDEVAPGLEKHAHLLAGLSVVSATAPGGGAQADHADASAGRSESATLHVGNLATYGGR